MVCFHFLMKDQRSYFSDQAYLHFIFVSSSQIYLPFSFLFSDPAYFLSVGLGSDYLRQGSKSSLSCFSGLLETSFSILFLLLQQQKNATNISKQITKIIVIVIAKAWEDNDLFFLFISTGFVFDTFSRSISGQHKSSS